MNNQILLCFDYGKKRIGVAVGQTISKTATALTTVSVTRARPDWATIQDLIDEWRPDTLIVGQPLTLAGERQKMTAAAERFGRELHGRFRLKVELIEEQLSSYAARRVLKMTRGLDPTAAKLILETWLSGLADDAHLPQGTDRPQDAR